MVKRSVKDGTKRRDNVPGRIIRPMPLRRGQDWNKDPLVQEAYRRGAPKYGPVTRAHLTEGNKFDKAMALTDKLFKIPYHKWSPEQMQEAQKVLGLKAVKIIVAGQNEAKRG